MPTNNLHISTEARADLEEIKAYISEELCSPAAALSTLKKISKRIRELKNFPLIGPSLSSVSPFDTPYRFLVSGNYLIFYRVCGRDIYVDRVLYGGRDYLSILFGKL